MFPPSFRVRKPSIARQKSDKPLLKALVQTQVEVPDAIIPQHLQECKNLSTKYRQAIDAEARTSDAAGSEPKTYAKAHGAFLDDLSPEKVSTDGNSQPQNSSAKDEGEEEDLYREVREDRKIVMGEDPLIADILSRFGDEASKD